MGGRVLRSVSGCGLAFTGQRLTKTLTLGLDPNLQVNPCAFSGFTSTVVGRHLRYLPLHKLKKEISDTGPSPTRSSGILSSTHTLSRQQQRTEPNED
jgi:hypothetical protein